MKVRHATMSHSKRPKNDAERKSLLLKHGWSNGAADDLIRRGLADQRLEQTGKIASLPADDGHELSDSEVKAALGQIEDSLDDYTPRDNWKQRAGETDLQFAARKGNL
jgi:hypothetical protein